MNINSSDKPVHSQVRRIRTTRRSLSGVYAFRGETPIQFESSLERDFVIRKEFSLAVLEVIPQPCQIPFIGENGRAFTYTPDFLVYYRLGDKAYPDFPRPVLIEVKPEAEWRKNWRKWLPKWKAAYRYAKEQGWAFHIHDETRIRDQAFENIKFLERYKRMQFPAEESRWIVDNVQQMGSAPLHFLLARHFMGKYRAEGISHLWYLLATRQLDCDITRPLNDTTELWIPTNE
ncbi:MAG: heteromeric transposase endonuclease subunit TnsA [Gammaproteobacteria bacterium]|nr:heteromeric transposase endonuclease subunit TnsA [Gammaproteobacteria bacterium]